MAIETNSDLIQDQPDVCRDISRWKPARREQDPSHSTPGRGIMAYISSAPCRDRNGDPEPARRQSETLTSTSKPSSETRHSCRRPSPQFSSAETETRTNLEPRPLSEAPRRNANPQNQLAGRETTRSHRDTMNMIPEQLGEPRHVAVSAETPRRPVKPSSPAARLLTYVQLGDAETISPRTPPARW